MFGTTGDQRGQLVALRDPRRRFPAWTSNLDAPRAADLDLERFRLKDPHADVGRGADGREWREVTKKLLAYGGARPPKELMLVS